jgi:hypothetical protein
MGSIGLESSLINPNQLRHNGTVVCGDPTDGNREFGVEISDSIFAPAVFALPFLLLH